jgi:hypothetical protein
MGGHLGGTARGIVGQEEGMSLDRVKRFDGAGGWRSATKDGAVKIEQQAVRLSRKMVTVDSHPVIIFDATILAAMRRRSWCRASTASRAELSIRLT